MLAQALLHLWRILYVFILTFNKSIINIIGGKLGLPLENLSFINTLILKWTWKEI